MAATGDNSIQVGDRLFNITGNLGKGGFSVVKKAYDEKTKKKVALKVMFTDEFKSQRERDVNINQAHKEIKAMRQLQNPNIIRLYGYDLNATFDERPSIILVQELALGGELFNYLLYTGKFSEPLAKYVFSQIMNGLKHAHSQGIAHRDLKPENILLDKHFQIKLADFGFAYAYMKQGEILNMRTELGTRGYMAPEIARTHSYDHKVDYFAAGVILFILLSGFPPFKLTENTDWWFDKIDNRKNDLFWMAHERKVTFSTQAKALIDGLLRTDPDWRFDIAEIEASEFLTTDNDMTREEFAREMKSRYKAVVQGKQGKQRNQSNLKDTIKNNLDVDVFSFEQLITNDIREQLLNCGDENTFEGILEEIKLSIDGAAKMCLEKKKPQFQGAEHCQQLGLASTSEEVAAGLGIENMYAADIFRLLKNTLYGEIEDYGDAKQYTALESVELPSFETAHAYDGFTGVFDIRCGMGTVAYALKKFLNEKKGEMEVDMDERKLILLFPVVSEGSVPEGDGWNTYEEVVNIVLEIQFYAGEKYNKMMLSRVGNDLSGLTEGAALLSELSTLDELSLIIVHNEDED